MKSLVSVFVSLFVCVEGFNVPDLGSFLSVSPSLKISRVESSDDLLPLATFRSNNTTPQSLVYSAQKLSDEFNSSVLSRVKSGLDGLFAGLIVGSLLSIFQAGALPSTLSLSSSVSSFPMTFEDTIEVLDHLPTGIVAGLVSGTFIGLNNARGKRVYVPTEADASRRLVNDYVNGVKSAIEVPSLSPPRGGDICFVVRDRSIKVVENPLLFEGTPRSLGSDIVACLDIQFRKSGGKYGKLPNHVHLKNMIVLPEYRRRGIATDLIKAAQDYIEGELSTSVGIPIKTITLEVDDINSAAISLYEKNGFKERASLATPGAKGQYGTLKIGRSIMLKRL